MKCPKCGYNSFEYLSACKKCHADLTAHKESLGIKPIIAPAFLQQATPPPVVAAAPEDVTEDLFSWDIADHTTAGAEPMPFEPVMAHSDSPATGGDDISFEFDSLSDTTAAPSMETPLPAGGNPTDTGKAALPWENTPAGGSEEVTSFAGMLESIDREAPVPEIPDEFSFDGLEGFEKVDIFAEDAEQKGKPADRAPTDPDDFDDFDALFSDEELSGD